MKVAGRQRRRGGHSYTADDRPTPRTQEMRRT